MIGTGKDWFLALELIEWILSHMELLARVKLIVDENRYFIIFPGEEEVKFVPSISLLSRIQVCL